MNQISGLQTILIHILQLHNRIAAHSGSSALKGECIPFVPPFLPVIGPVGICDGDTDEGFPIEFRFNSLKGFYKFNPQGGDQIYISLLLIADTAAIGVGAVLLNSAASYTEFGIPITYIDASTPNKCIISFQILNPVGGVNVTLGSEMYLMILNFLWIWFLM